MSEYGFSVEVPEGYDEAVIRTRMAMRAEGFSILTEMHVGGMLQGAGEDFGEQRQYLIMGIFNAAVSSKRIDSDLQVAVHLPTNFVVQEIPPGAVVAALDPSETVDITQTSPELIEQARAALVRALDKVARPV
ncbi:MAG: DUF302 domain-containing protein [Actinomycetota bacterium]